MVGGIDAASGRLAQLLYGQAMAQVVPVSNCEIAEAAKILENTYRAVNIALVNELKVLFTRMGIDVWEVIDAARTKPFGFQAFYPGPGLGGHCIPIDPFYLTWLARRNGMTTRFIELAGEINTGMPEYVVHRLVEALNDRGKPLRGSTIAVLGVAYKKDVDDPRESPSFRLMELLLAGGARADLQRSAHAAAARDAALRPAGHGELPAHAGVPGRPGLRADRHGPLGLRLRVHRPACPAGGRHPQRHEERPPRDERKDRQGLTVLELHARRSQEVSCSAHHSISPRTSIGSKSNCVASIPRRSSRLADLLYQAWKDGRSVFIFGNGGSACSASHLCEDLGKGCLRAGRPARRDASGGCGS